MSFPMGRGVCGSKGCVYQIFMDHAVSTQAPKISAHIAMKRYKIKKVKTSYLQNYISFLPTLTILLFCLHFMLQKIIIEMDSQRKKGRHNEKL
jgi:hypothetical protein